MKYYNKIISGNRLEYNRTRKDVGVGENSPDTVMNSRDYFLVQEVKPTIDTATQRYSGTSFSFDGTIDTKTWSVVDIPAEELIAKQAKMIETTVQTMLDNSAKSRGYDSIISECSYATSTGAFGAEAQVTVNWRDDVWQKVFEIQALPTNEQPATIDDFMALLPARV